MINRFLYNFAMALSIIFLPFHLFRLKLRRVFWTFVNDTEQTYLRGMGK